MPPMPEEHIEIKSRPDGARAEICSASIGTRNLNSSQWIAGLSFFKLVCGGTMLVLKMEHTFDKEARKDVISAWPILPLTLPMSSSPSRAKRSPTQLANDHQYRWPWRVVC